AISDPKWVRAYVAEPDLGKIRTGMPASVAADGFRDRHFDGWIGFISPVAEFTPKSVQTEELRTSLVYEVRVFVKDPGAGVRRRGSTPGSATPRNQAAGGRSPRLGNERGRRAAPGRAWPRAPEGVSAG